METVIDAGNAARAFKVSGIGTLQARGLRILNGSVAKNGGALLVDGASANAHLTACSIVKSSAGENGGGIAVLNDGRLLLRGSTLSENVATEGGGLYLQGVSGTSEAIIYGGTVESNRARTFGGIALTHFQCYYLLLLVFVGGIYCSKFKVRGLKLDRIPVLINTNFAQNGGGNLALAAASMVSGMTLRMGLSNFGGGVHVSGGQHQFVNMR
jgi:hypothetical protein